MAARAAQPPSTRPEKDPLAARQEMVRDRMNQLEDRMFRLAEKLAESEPEQAERLRAALEKSRELLVRRSMEEISLLLESGQVGRARERQEALVADLNRLLKIMTETPDESGALEAEARRLRELKERLARLTERQAELRREAQHAEPADEVDRLRRSAERIEAAIEREQKAIERTRQAAPGDVAQGAAQASEQADIRAKVQETAADINAADRTTPSATRPVAGADATAAREALDQAAGQMRHAETALAGGRFDGARPAQEGALESLREALEAVRRAMGRAARPDANRLADQQRRIAGEARRLAEDMQGRPEGQPGSEGSTPGRENVERAGGHMEQGAGELEAGRAGEATRHQDRAIEELREAMRRLEEELQQVRREQQEEILGGLEERFREMLARQLKINEDTVALDRKGADKWERPDELLAGAAARGERDLADQAEGAGRVLREEGTTVVFPEVVEQLAADLLELSGRLAAQNVGSATQRLQADVVETLQGLVEAVAQKRRTLQDPSGVSPGAQPGQERPPLLPGSAELKLLRACQMRVNRQTNAFIKAAGTDPDLTPEQQEELRRLSDRQKQVETMARQMYERAAGP